MSGENPDLAVKRGGELAPGERRLASHRFGAPPPVPLSSFVGRHAECAVAAGLLADHRLLTLTGTGGIGKTRLAIELVASGALRALGEVAWVDLARVASATGVDTALLDALTLTRGLGATPVDLIANHLSGHQGILLIDNCEQVATEVGQRAQHILQRCPGIRILATSRSPLDVNGEATWLVPPLSLESMSPPGLSDAAALFLARSRAAIGEGAFSLADLGHVDAICRALEGVPLAIELAAAHLRVSSVREVHDGLVDRLGLLAGGSHNELPRHRAVRASIDWSHDLLSDGERVLLRRLSVFDGGWNREAMLAVCAGEGLAAEELASLLGQLVLKSMVLAQRAVPATRYSLSESVRQYARERLVDSPEAAAVGDRYVAHFVALAQQADLECWVLYPDRRSILDAEAANIASALAHACSTADVRALELVGHLGTYWREIGAMEQGASSIAEALCACPAAPSPARAFALMWDGCFAFLRGDVPHATERLAECGRVLEHAPSQRVAAWLAGVRATMTSVLDPVVGPDPLERAYSLALQAGDKLLASYLLVPMLIAYDCRDDAQAVQRTSARAGAAAAQMGHQFLQRWIAWSLARQAMLAGDLKRCHAELDAIRTLSTQDAEVNCGSAALESIAAALAGDLASARERAGRAQDLAREGRYWMGTGNIAVALGFMALAGGDLVAARRLGSHLASREDGGAHLPVHGHELLLLAALAGGDASTASAGADALKSLAGRFGNRRAAALAVYGWGAAALLADDPTRAAALGSEALDLQLAGGWAPGAIASLELIASSEHALGRSQRCALLLGAATAARKRLGVRRLTRLPPGPCELERKAGEGVLDQRLAQAWTKGQRVDLGGALACAGIGNDRGAGQGGSFAILTPAERAVAHLASAGRSNPDIAESLVITRATVKTHLSHIYAKLGVANRTELAALSRRSESVASW